jgi:3-oxoacyl-(acyl-carrier-protein) synthase
MVAPSGEGGQRCMREAIAMANKIGGDKPVDYVNTHGTSTPVGDVKELGAIQGLFDEEFDYFPKVGSTKSLSGHALSVAGVHEAIYSLLMMDRGFLAESANIFDIVDEAEGVPILTGRHAGPGLRCFSTPFGFGGPHPSLRFQKSPA